MSILEHMKKQDEFLEKEFAHLINKNSRENRSDTPDFILAQFLIQSLVAFENEVNRRDEWYRKDEIPVEKGK